MLSSVLAQQHPFHPSFYRLYETIRTRLHECALSTVRERGLRNSITETMIAQWVYQVELDTAMMTDAVIEDVVSSYIESILNILN